MIDNYSTKNQLNLPRCLQFNSPSSLVCGNSRFHGSHLVSRARMLGETGAFYLIVLFYRISMEDEKYPFEDFLHMTLSSLHDYLGLRALSKSGCEAELVARAFGTYELKAPIKYTQEKISQELKKL